MPVRPIAVALFAVITPGVAAQAPRADLGLRVFGIVRNLRGDPVAGAEVRTIQLAQPGLPQLAADLVGVGLATGASTRTDRHGKFVLSTGAVGRFGVVALVGAAARSGVVAPASPGRNYELTLHPVRRVRGRVVERRDGKEAGVGGQRICSLGPVRSGVDVRPVPDRRFGVIGEATTGADGHFEIEVLGGAKCAIEPGFGHPATEIELLASAAASGAAAGAKDGAGRILVRRAGRRIQCTVVDATNRAPVSTARIHAADTIVPVDAKGVAALDAPRDYHAYVTAPGYRSTCIACTQSGAIEVKLARAPGVQLRITDDSGRPRPGLTVCIIGIVGGAGGSGPLAMLTTTDAEGRLRLTRPAGFGVVLWARIENRYVRAGQIASSTRKVVMSNLSVGSVALRGTILGVDGVPAAHLPVFADPVQSVLESNLPLAQWPVAFTDHAGRFVIPGLTRQIYSIASRSPRSLVTFSQLVTPGAPSNRPLRLRLLRAPMIRGKVIDEAGAGIARAQVTATVGRKGVDARLYQFGLWTRSCQTDADGRFTLPAVWPQTAHTLRVAVRGQRLESNSVRIEPPAKDLEIVVRRPK